MAARNFLSTHKVVMAKAAQTAATSDVASDIIDTAGYGGVAFVTAFGTAAANNTIQVEQDAVNGAGGMLGILGSKVTCGASGKAVVSVATSPQDRYVRAVLKRGTSSTSETIWAVLFNANTIPQTSNVTDVLAAKELIATAEGTP
jgi:hypothetical protein